MKKTLLTSLFLAAATVSAPAAVTYGQFFNNNNASFTDSQSGLYNWNFATANNIATVANDISAGNTTPPVSLPGETTLGRGFFFLLPQNSTEGAGATFMYTTHTGISTVEQNNPQPDWFQDGGSGTLAGTALGDISNVLVRSNSGSSSSFQARLGVQVGSDWYLSDTAYTLSTSWTEFNLPNLASETWITGAFDGVNLDADVSDNLTTLLGAGDVVTGYGWYADVEATVGGSSRIRMDRMVLTVVPEPSTYALLVGALIALAVIARRR